MRKLVFYYHSYFFYLLALFGVTYYVSVYRGLGVFLPNIILISGIAAVAGSGRKHLKKNDFIAPLLLVSGIIVQLVFLGKLLHGSKDDNTIYALAVAWFLPSIWSIGMFLKHTSEENLELNRWMTRRLVKYFAVCGAVFTIGFLAILKYYAFPRTSTANEVATILVKLVLLIAILFILVEMLFYFFYKKEVRLSPVASHKAGAKTPERYV